jgi:predicted fused transcriptional regulator/phosphomethylpyrimidine kinase
MKTRRTYYWEHATDPNRYLWSSSARKLAEVVHAAGGVVGVIVDLGDHGLVVQAVPIGRTVRDTAQALARA